MGVVDSPGLFAFDCAAGRGSSCASARKGKTTTADPRVLAFHGLFISPRDYRRAGADPFVFLPWLRDDWNDKPWNCRPNS